MLKSADRQDLAHHLVRGELIGRRARVAASPDPTLLHLEGDVVNETMKTFTIRTPGGRKVVSKLDQTFAFLSQGTEVLLRGQDLAYRPEDRIKKARVKR